jgi:hypothetical protein
MYKFFSNIFLKSYHYYFASHVSKAISGSKFSVLPDYQHKGGIPPVLLEEKTTLLCL